VRGCLFLGFWGGRGFVSFFGGFVVFGGVGVFFLGGGVVLCGAVFVVLWGRFFFFFFFVWCFRSSKSLGVAFFFTHLASFSRLKLSYSLFSEASVCDRTRFSREVLSF